MIIPIIDTANVGMVQDTPPTEAPINAWSYLFNLSPQDGALVPASGAVETITASEVPEFLLSVATTANRYILSAGATEIHLHTASTNVDITPTIGVNGAPNSWTGGMLGTVPVFNDGTSGPWMWNPQTTGTLVSGLSNWISGWSVGSLRIYQNYLIGMDVTKSGTRYGQLLMWSHPADPGAVPISWDETNPTYDAGSYPLLDTDGNIVDGLEMRGMFIVGKEDSIWSMRYIGGTLIFQFNRLFQEGGLIAKNCICNISAKADKQVIWLRDDIILHNGSEGESLLSKRLRRWLFVDINPASTSHCFIAKHVPSSEVWFCYASVKSTYPNRALVWNWSTNTFSVRNLPASLCATTGQFSGATANETWDGDTTTWNEKSITWDQRLFNTTALQTLFGGADSKIYWIGAGDSWPWETYGFRAERLSLPVIGQQGKPIVDVDSVKLVTEIWPRVILPGGSTMNVEVGWQMSLSEPVTWEPAQTFDPSVLQKINCLVSGRYISVRFTGSSRAGTKILGFDLNINRLSTY